MRLYANTLVEAGGNAPLISCAASAVVHGLKAVYVYVGTRN